jgi:hypothetical protein
MMEPPHCYSVDEDLAKPYELRIGRLIEVLLDNEPQSHVLSYDVQTGVVERFATDEDDKIVLDWREGEAVRETLKGQVIARWREGTSCPA